MSLFTCMCEDLHMPVRSKEGGYFCLCWAAPNLFDLWCAYATLYCNPGTAQALPAAGVCYTAQYEYLGKVLGSLISADSAAAGL